MQQNRSILCLVVFCVCDVSVTRICVLFNRRRKTGDNDDTNNNKKKISIENEERIMKMKRKRFAIRPCNEKKAITRKLWIVGEMFWNWNLCKCQTYAYDTILSAQTKGNSPLSKKKKEEKKNLSIRIDERFIDPRIYVCAVAVFSRDFSSIFLKSMDGEIKTTISQAYEHASTLFLFPHFNSFLRFIYLFICCSVYAIAWQIAIEYDNREIWKWKMFKKKKKNYELL